MRAFVGSLRDPKADAKSSGGLLPLVSFLGLSVVLLSSACDLSDVEVPTTERQIVVHGVMRADKDRQFIIVEESFSGDGDSIVFMGRTIPTDDSPAQPIQDATVRVANLSYPDDPCGNPVLFQRDPGDGDVPLRAGVYWSPLNCPTIRPGDSLVLTIETPDSGLVTGETVVAGMESAVLLVHSDTIQFGQDTVVSFNRDHQTMRIRVEPTSGRLLQVEVMRVGQLDMDVEEDILPGARIYADTTRVTLPGDLVDAAGWSDGGDVFRPGRTYIMAVAITDVNFFDFGRSSSNKFTGRGFINHLDGGIGVFGSLSAASLGLRVLGNFNDPREGVYRLRGTIQDVTIDAELTLFMTRAADEAEVSCFLNGDWFHEEATGGGVVYLAPWHADSASFEGTIDGNSIRLAGFQEGVEGNGRRRIMRVTIIGERKDDASFVLSVADSVRIRSFQLGLLTAQQN
ncbi:MAG: DUF4249 family protein [Myxococcota bacterium]|nr:DUF4249 family protein [Myxococcota bacterium]